MILLSFVMLLLNSVFSPIQQARYIDVSISEFQKTLKIFSSRDVSSTILWTCKLKPSHKGNVKKPIVDLSRNIIHMSYSHDLFSPIWNNTKQYERFQICGDLKITFAKRKDDANIYKKSIFQ